MVLVQSLLRSLAYPESEVEEVGVFTIMVNLVQRGSDVVKNTLVFGYD